MSLGFSISIWGIVIPKYNLNALGEQEFEHLCQALIQEIIGSGAKIYGMGADGAREATFQGKAPFPSQTEQWDGNWIFQAKFHDELKIGPREARRQLLSDLKNELSKVVEKHEYNCNNYILMTNVSLTPVAQKGLKDSIDEVVIPRYVSKIKHIQVLGGEEICRFLDANPKIRQTYSHFLVSGDIIAYLLNLIERDQTDLDELVRLYCEGCHAHEQYAALDDAGDIEEKRVELQKVFVDLKVKSQAIPKEITQARLKPWMKQALEDEQRTSAMSYLLDDSILSLMLIGGPGSGKSTICQHVAQIYRARLIGRIKEIDHSEETKEYEDCVPRIPFRILLREYAQWISANKDHDSLFHFLAEKVSQETIKATPNDIKSILKSTSVFLILDGLDEVPEKNLRKRVIDNIMSFVNQARFVLKSDMKVAATTRPHGYSEEFNPTHYLNVTIQKLESSQATTYAHRWISIREPIPDEEERIRNTFKTCLEDNIVCVLTQTPLQVTILLVIIRARGTPPSQREELFERYVDIIYHREQKKRPELLRTEQDIINGLHKYLAYLLHRRAQRDRTAALMDIELFRKHVQVYLAHTNPLLTKSELESKTGQIIQEASQRLVLIESPYEGKIGFSLPTTREFFTAAHLVDTAINSKERDARFRAIATSPYWRNVALFFAGRIGRRLPGEAPSLIDVCRDIDTGSLDKFLRRGSELVLEMVDDRVLREPHNELAAIQYALEMLDNRYVRDFDGMMSYLRNLREEYKERIVRPWLENRLREKVPESLKIFIETFQGLFKSNATLVGAIKKETKSAINRVKLTGLSHAIENRLTEPWVMRTFEALAKVLPRKRLIDTLSPHWKNCKDYIDVDLTSEMRNILLVSYLRGFERSLLREHSPLRQMKNRLRLLHVDPCGKEKKTRLLFWAVTELEKLIFDRLFSRSLRTFKVELDFVLLCVPRFKKWVNQNSDLIKKCCRVFSKETDLVSRCVVSLFEFLLDPSKTDTLVEIGRQMTENSSMISQIILKRIINQILGDLPKDAEHVKSYHKDLFNAANHWQNENNLLKDKEELNSLLNKAGKVQNHEDLMLWVRSDFDSALKESMDSSILNSVEAWFSRHNLPKCHRLFLPSYIQPFRSNPKTCELALQLIETQIIKREELFVNPCLIRYSWRRTRDKDLIDRLIKVSRRLLTDYSAETGKDLSPVKDIYLALLSADVEDEKLMVEIYEALKHDDKPISWRIFETIKSKTSILTKMLKSDDVRVTRLAAVTLAERRKYHYSDPTLTPLATWIGEKLWRLSTDTKDLWRPYYLRGMASCKLIWSKRTDKFQEAIRNLTSENLVKAWVEIIQTAVWSSIKDRRSLLIFLLALLNKHEVLQESIRDSAIRRLHILESEIPTDDFDESALNLPLRSRVRCTC